MTTPIEKAASTAAFPNTTNPKDTTTSSIKPLIKGGGIMTNTFDTHSTFNPFGEAVRINVYGHVELVVNLKDLCNIHSVDYEESKKIHYPNGSVSLLPIEQGNLATEIYLNEDAFPVFMAWVEVQT